MRFSTVLALTAVAASAPALASLPAAWPTPRIGIPIQALHSREIDEFLTRRAEDEILKRFAADIADILSHPHNGVPPSLVQAREEELVARVVAPSIASLLQDKVTLHTQPHVARDDDELIARVFTPASPMDFSHLAISRDDDGSFDVEARHWRSHHGGHRGHRHGFGHGLYHHQQPQQQEQQEQQQQQQQMGDAQPQSAVPSGSGSVAPPSPSGATGAGATPSQTAGLGVGTQEIPGGSAGTEASGLPQA